MLTPRFSDCISPLQCRRFVHQFAHRVAGDALLGRAFPRPHHAPDGGECAWWEQALLGNRYTGRPLQRDAAPLFTASQLERWCRLLETSLDEALDVLVAAEAKGHVLNLATMRAYWQFHRLGTGAHAPQQPAALAAA
ncbi:globin family protein [Hymenobacter armeniacus]|uniref:Uncharacterized protein n=1 Tax=Hymenobacter armeniacus TaxID=2771358 RepID=A0ABR8JTM2_9BACT|nr:hypothetical protein [Hymenobacter armeniacus]MBD2721059.1 hypothetical protein [Hymenobacter armeniacus]